MLYKCFVFAGGGGGDIKKSGSGWVGQAPTRIIFFFWEILCYFGFFVCFFLLYMFLKDP